MTSSVLRVARRMRRGIRSSEALTGLASLVILAIAVFGAVGVSITRQATAATTSQSARPPQVIARITLDDPDRAVLRGIDPRSGLQPLFGPRYRTDDGKPVYVCVFSPGAAAGVLPLIQQAGLDVAHGFHLALVPVGLDARYRLTAARVGGLVRDGGVDCALTTLDAVALHGGAVTLIAGESTGADAIWARDASNIDDLRGRHIAVVRGAASEFVAISALSRVGLDPALDAKLRRFDTPADALAAFNAGDADAVVGRAPAILGALDRDGRPVPQPAAVRDVIDVIATSPHSIATRGDVVQRFHDAWFEALSLQSSRPETAAAHVGRWGYASWTGVNASNAGLDWHAQLRGIAQADAHQNARVFLDDALLQRRVTDARMAWRAAGVNIAEDGVIDGRFVTAYVARAEPSLLLAFPNPGFALDRAAMSPAADRRSSLLSSTQRLQDLIESGDSAHARALRSPSPEPMRVSSCDQVAFDPESEQLTPRMQTLLDQCVSALIASQAQVIVRVTGSSAWPGPFGRYNRAQIESVSRARAKLVADYLAAQGIDRRYIELRFMLPPLSRRETLDTSIQSRDRFVALEIFRQ